MRDIISYKYVAFLGLLLFGMSYCHKPELPEELEPMVKNDTVSVFADHVVFSWEVDYPGKIISVVEVATDKDLTDMCRYGLEQLTAEKTFSVRVDSLMDGTTYYYRYVAWNHYMKYEGEVKHFMTTQSFLPSLTTDTVTEVTTTTATFAGTIVDDGGAEVTDCGFCWAPHAEPTLADSVVSCDAVIGTFTGSLKGLTPGTQYYVRAYATNHKGTSYGDELNFTTLKNAYAIVALADPEDGGTVEGGGTFEEGMTCALTATPNTGYRFVNWTEDGNSVSTEATYTITVTCDRTLVAVFTTQEYVVTVLADPQEGGDVQGGGGYSLNQECTVTATPNVGYEFKHWKEGGEVVSEDATYNFTVTNNRELTACFTLLSYEIQVSAEPMYGGTVSGGDIIQYNALCTVTAMAYEGYTFLNWSENGNVVSYNAEYSFTVSGNRTLVAHFQVQSFTIDVSANPVSGGDVFGGGTFNFGQLCTVNASAHPGYEFISWTEGDNVVSNLASYPFTLNGNRTLVANFELIGTINGLFSVSDTLQVYFSQGNLQYIGSNNRWSFADHQWDVIGTSQGNSNPSTTRDLFGWGTSGYNHGAECYQPWSTSTSNSDYYAYGNPSLNLNDYPGKADWGYNAIANGGDTENSGWRTLTHDEWVYVLKTRTMLNGGPRYTLGRRVEGVLGVVIYPDNYAGAAVSSDLTAEGWAEYEDAGCVFLPAAGIRYGTSVYGVGSYSRYWSASYYDANDAWNVYFNDSNLNTGSNNNRYNGQSVRLVRSAQ